MSDDYSLERLNSESPCKRNIIIIGNLGAGKSHSGNGILGKQVFVSKRCWSLVTENCTHGLGMRNGIFYQVFDTPGLNICKNLQKDFDVKTEIKRCLMCISPGFHAIVLVLSADERISKDITKLFDGVLEDNVYEYMIIVVSKLENDNQTLNELMSEHPSMLKLYDKCSRRLVVFGDDPKTIPTKCVENFDDILTELIKKNSNSGKEFYKDRYADKAMKILEKDRDDYLIKYPSLSKKEALEKVQIIAAKGYSPRGEEIIELLPKKIKCCTIL